jgi:hypothetical protein
MTNYETKDGFYDDDECDNKFDIMEPELPDISVMLEEELRYLKKKLDVALNALDLIQGNNGMCWVNEKQEAREKTGIAKRAMERIALIDKQEDK